MAAGGRGVARHDGFVLLVSGAVPGDRVRARIERCHARHAEAYTVEVLDPSTLRVEPPCAHADVCGGCPAMALAPDAQDEAKRDLVADALRRIGKLAVDVEPLRPSPARLGYRNRLDLAFGVRGGRLVAGLHERRRPESVFPLTLCRLAPGRLSELALSITRRLQERGDGVWRHPARPGLLRQLVLRTNRDGTEVLAGLVTGPGPWDGERDLAEALLDEHPDLVGVARTEHHHRSLARRGSEHVLAGRGHLVETLGGLALEVGPAAFFQVNTGAAERLHEDAVGLLDPSPAGRLVDLYSGSGVLSLLGAGRFAEAVGVESDTLAVESARRNAVRNGVRNVRFVAGPAGEVLPVLAPGPEDRVIANPPRAGLEPEVVAALVAAAPRTVVYISCNPATLARDLARLVASGLRVDTVRPYDLFPQTAHVETVVRLVHGPPA